MREAYIVIDDGGEVVAVYDSNDILEIKKHVAIEHNDGLEEEDHIDHLYVFDFYTIKQVPIFKL